MKDTEKPMQGTWTLTAPDGRQWQAVRVDMTDTEIDRRLALAIGYRPADVRQTLGRMVIVNRPSEVKSEFWAPFDHTEWETIGPIAEKFDLFPVRLTDGKWSRVVCGPAPAFLLTDIIESTPQRCIALAALCALERK